MKHLFAYLLSLFPYILCASINQNDAHIVGHVVDAKTREHIGFVSVALQGTTIGIQTDSTGHYFLKDLPVGNYTLVASSLGYKTETKSVNIRAGKLLEVNFELKTADYIFDEVVVTGTIKPVSRLNSPVPVEVITPQLFCKNPTPSLFDAVEMVNGVRPQLNCNVCNTGDIHINGMEGPYTLVLIDGMPIVSALSSVYGLSGIPNSMVERLEVVKGPAASLYGSEAMGGIINVVTKNPDSAPRFQIDGFGTSWSEYNLDIATKLVSNNKLSGLLGVNYFNYTNPMDKNKDGFTDIAPQNRVSVFTKWNFKRKDNRTASLGARYVYENRWGGQMNWTPEWRYEGQDSIYGESIYTKRFELIGAYQLPTVENIFTQFSYNWHDQDAMYASTPFLARQQVLFGQMYWDKPLAAQNDLLLGATVRYTYYDDNTPATATADGAGNQPDAVLLPGVFVQDQWNMNTASSLLAGYRFDYDSRHGAIHSPRIAYKFSPNSNNVVRASLGTGFRVVNLFTEDHASLIGARELVIEENLEPERSINSNLNYVLKLPSDNHFVGFDLMGFYSYFTNKIVADIETDPRKIIYANLDGHAISRGASLNMEMLFNFPLTLRLGATFADVYLVEPDDNNNMIKRQQLHAPKWSGTYQATYDFPNDLIVDLTGTWTGPMRLPVFENDFRPEYSPLFALMNLKVGKKLCEGVELYGGVKNVLNFVPKDPIMRPFDPFNKYVDDPVSNPNNYSFDPSYNYAPMQGRRLYVGIRYTI